MRTIKRLFTSILQDTLNANVLWNIVSLVILGIAGILVNTLIIILRGNEALGIFNQVFAFYIFLSQLATGGLQYSVLKHISHNQTDLRACFQITLSSLLLVTIIAIPLSLLLYYASPTIGVIFESPMLTDGIRFIIPGLYFFAINKILLNTLNGLQHMQTYAFFRTIRWILLTLLILGIVLSQATNAYIPLSLTITEFVLFLILAGYVFRYSIPITNPENITFWFYEHISFGVRGMFSGILSELNTRVDILMLGVFLSDELVGVYSFVAILTEGFSQLPLALRWNIDPKLGEYFSSHTPEEIPNLAKTIRQRFLLPIIGLIAIGCIGYPIGYAIVVGDDFIGISWSVFLVIMIGVMINTFYRPFGGILLQSGRPAIHTAMIVILVINNVLWNLLLIQIFSLLGAAIATSITYMLEAILIRHFAKKFLSVQIY
jgi:O-antigen/teichoic acid export membrane protein